MCGRCAETTRWRRRWRLNRRRFIWALTTARRQALLSRCRRWLVSWDEPRRVQQRHLVTASTVALTWSGRQVPGQRHGLAAARTPDRRPRHRNTSTGRCSHRNKPAKNLTLHTPRLPCNDQRTRLHECLQRWTVIICCNGSRAFTVAGSRVWNTLPVDITTSHSSQSLSTFCQHLKTWLFRKSYPDVII